MFKFVRKHKKEVGVVLGVVLMIMFLGNLGPQGAQRNTQIMRTAGTIGNVKVTQLQLSNSAAEWQFLKSLAYVNPNDSTARPLPLMMAVTLAFPPVKVPKTRLPLSVTPDVLAMVPSSPEVPSPSCKAPALIVVAPV